MDFSEGLAAVRMDGKVGYVDKTGKFVVGPRFQWGSRFSEGLAAVELFSRARGRPPLLQRDCVYIDKRGVPANGKRVLWAGKFSEGLAAVLTSDNHVGYISRSGKLVIKIPMLASAEPFSEGLAVVGIRSNKHDYKSVRYGFIDKTGHWVVSPKFNSASSFRNGLAEVGLGGKSTPRKIGYVNKKGHYVWKPTN